MTVQWNNKTDVGTGTIYAGPKTEDEIMQQRRVSGKPMRRIMIVASLAVWVCIVLCVIQIIQTMRLRAQMSEQR